MTLRIATEKDFNPIYEIYMDPTVNPYMGFEVLSPSDFRPIYQEISQPPSTTYVYESDHQVHAVCIVTRKKRRQAHGALIKSLGVKSQSQGKGIGRKFLEELIEMLRQENYARIELTVEADNPTAIRLYEKLGFKKEGTLKNFFKRAEENHFIDELWMGLLLKS